MEATKTGPPDSRLDGAVHGWFGLSYANYLVLPRTLMQSMPEQWQDRMVACLGELDVAFGHIERAEAYEVTAGQEVEVGDLSDAQRELLGVARHEVPEGEDDDRATVYYDKDGNELERWYRVILPGEDPVPHYNRGRTFVPPAGN